MDQSKTKSISLSTIETKYVSANEAAKEALWLYRLFNEIVVLKSVPKLLVDNESAIKLAKNPEFHKNQSTLMCDIIL